MGNISNIITLKSVYCALFRFIIKYGIIEGGGVVTLPTAGRISLYKRKSSELWLVQNPEPHVDVNLYS